MSDKNLLKIATENREELDRYRLFLDGIAHAGRSITGLTLTEGSVLEQLRKNLRGLEENYAVTSMLKSMKDHQEIARAALGPRWDLQRTGAFDLDTRWTRDFDVVRKEMEAFRSRFSLPEITETRRLVKEFAKLREFEQSSFSKLLAPYANVGSDLKQALEGMSTPWLDAAHAMRSVYGFAEIQAISHAMRTLPAFDEQLSTALRLDLGDWRDPIDWRPEIFTDLAVRSDFYVSLGFNPALTDFPPPAFKRSLDIAGLRSGLSRPRGYAEKAELAEDDVEEEPLVRTNRAHDQLQRLERFLRKFIDERMTQAFGADWPKHRLPNGLYDRWQDKKLKAEQAGAPERPVIEYADFTDYEPVICKTDNWRLVFARFFTRPESVRESFQRLHPVRLDTMHARLITQDDELLLYVEVRRLRKAARQKHN